jgi:YebC/PmpR family DNA-binding regulatory protein
MPKDNIARAIARGTGDDKDGVALETVVYEGYGPHSSAILVQATTDNRNRTVGEIRFLFSKYGGNMGEAGSVAWQFAQRGMLTLPVAEADPDELALEAIDAGAIDVEADGDQVVVYTEAGDFMRVRTALDEAGHPSEDAQLAMIPTTPLELGERETVQVLKFLDALDDLDDVDQVWSNIEISDEAAAAFEAE